MASIRTAVELQDNFSTVVYSVVNSVNMMISTMDEMNRSMNADVDTSSIEGIRDYMNQATIAASQLNNAIDNIDASAPARSQEHYNETIRQGTSNANALVDTIKGAVTAYATIETVKGALNASDELSQTISRLNLMNDGVQSTQDLFNMIYVSANNSHAPLLTTADAIAKMGNNAGNAFNSTQELVSFMEQINKQFAIGGASAQEQSNALIQLSQAMASGALRGDELNSILDAAPEIARAIESNMGWAEGSIKSYAEQGQVTAQVVKNSMLNMADETNAKFEQMPLTFSQVMTDMQSTATKAFQPVLERINEIANSEGFQNFVNIAINDMAILAGYVLEVFDIISQVGSFIYDNWGTIAPLIGGIVTAFIAYNGVLLANSAIQGIHNIQKAIATIQEYAHAKSILANASAYSAEAVATASATVAQASFNTALLACPTTWIIAGIIAIIAVIVAVANHIADTTNLATSAFGVICGTLATAGAFILNIIIGLINSIITGGVNLYNMIANFASAFSVIFNDPVAAIKATILSLFNFIVSTVRKAAEILDAVFNSNLADAVSGFQDKIQAEIDATVERAGGKTANTLNPSDYTLNRINYGDAFKAGAKWGDGVSSKVTNAFSSKAVKLPKESDYANALANGNNSAAQTAANTANTAKNTAKTADAVAVTAEDLKYLRDMAEQEVVNRYTTASITVNAPVTATINNDMDLDGVTEHLRSTMEEQMAAAAEGVH